MCITAIINLSTAVMHPPLTSMNIPFCPQAVETSSALTELEDVHFITVVENEQGLSMQLFYCDHFTVVAISEQVIQRPMSQ